MLSRRAALVLPVALPLSSLTPAYSDALPPLAMVMNSGEASVSIIDMNSRQVIKTTPTLREPSHWALSPDKTKLFIADASGNSLFILDPLTGDGLGFKRIADPYQLAYTPDQKYLVVNALRLDHVDVYDAVTLNLVKRFAAGSMPSHLDFSPDSRWSFNSCQGSDTLVSIDLPSMSIRWKSKIGKTPAGVLWLNGKILTCVMGSDHLVVVDPLTGEVIRKVVTGIGPHNLFLSPDRSVLYVSNRVGGSLAALDPVSLTLQRTYPLPGGPDDMGISPDGKLWIALRFREKVAVMDAATGDYDTIDVGRSPHGIFLNTEMAKPGKFTAEVL
jgi:DNA-binding beta-propeller fold protein YncE